MTAASTRLPSPAIAGAGRDGAVATEGAGAGVAGTAGGGAIGAGA
jgi:hypothetical protein